jgi:hypothetical protein
LLAWRVVQQDVASARADLDRARAERATLERRVNLLYPESLDPDMLDESARSLLNYGLPGEVVVLDEKAPRRSSTSCSDSAKSCSPAFNSQGR